MNWCWYRYNHLLNTSSTGRNPNFANVNLVLVVAQSSITIVFLMFCKKINWIDYPPFSVQAARKWVGVNLWFTAMLYTGVCSFQYNSVPIVIIYKNLTNLLVTLGDYGLFTRNTSQHGSFKESLGTFGSFAIMIIGAVLASYSDGNTSTVGLFWMILNGITTATYILSMKAHSVKLSKFGMLYYNNVMALLWHFPLSIWMGKWTLLLKSPDLLNSLEYWLTIALNGTIGFGLNFASLQCVAATGPTTYAIIGSFNKIPMVLLGYYWFEKEAFSMATWSYIVISLMGGFLYSYTRITSRRKMSRLVHG